MPTEAQIYRNGTIIPEYIANNAVGTLQINNSAVTTDKIANGSVTDTKIANLSANILKIADDSVTPEKLSVGGPTWDTAGKLNINRALVRNTTYLKLGDAYISSGTYVFQYPPPNAATIFYPFALAMFATNTYFTSASYNTTTTVTSGTSWQTDGRGPGGLYQTYAEPDYTTPPSYPLKNVYHAWFKHDGRSGSLWTPTNLMFLYNNGNLSILGTLFQGSDIKLKENIKTIENALDKVLQLRGVEFDYKETGKHSLGFIAQEVEKVIPYLVFGDDTKSVAYQNFVALLVEAIKELKLEIEMLKNIINSKK